MSIFHTGTSTLRLSYCGRNNRLEGYEIIRWVQLQNIEKNKVITDEYLMKLWLLHDEDRIDILGFLKAAGL